MSTGRTLTAPRRANPCGVTTGRGDKSYFVAVGLSLFLGALGADRFYLGYLGMGFLKLATLGLFFIGYLVDLVLILLQVLGPLDGTDFQVPATGPGLTHMIITNATYFVPLA